MYIIFSSNALNTTRSSEPIIVEESLQEAHETSVSTEIYDDESLEIKAGDVKFIEKPHMEIASRIIWTTPKTMTTETRKATINKETATATIQVTPSRENGVKNRNLRPEISEYEDFNKLNSTTTTHTEFGESICS